MHWGTWALLLALAAGVLLAPAALAHEPTPAELEALVEAANETASAARTLALAGLVAGLGGLAAGVISLIVGLRRR